MVERNRVDHHEFAQVVLVGYVVAVPGHHVKRAVVLLIDEEFSLEFGDDFVVVDVAVFVGGDWG